MNAIQHTSLYFKQGASDKIYQAMINKVDGGYTVTFTYGRRGAALKAGTKTAEPVELEKAEKIFNSLLKSKKNKGYTEGVDGTVFTSSEQDKEHSGVYLQLLNEVNELSAISLCNDSRYFAQEKYDGERRAIKCDSESVQGINKKGLFTSLTQPIADHALNLNDSFVIDAEAIGDILYAFDLLEYRGKDCKSLAFHDRYEMLSNLIKENDAIVLVETATTTKEKLALFERVKNENGEGLVFKNFAAEYTTGRPNSGGNQFKYKFYAECSVIVESHNEGKRSVAISGFDQGTRIPLGNVTIPPNKDIPKVNKVIEVRYLYVYRNGSLFQPIYKGERRTVDHDECTLNQLKYKRDCAA